MTTPDASWNSGSADTSRPCWFSAPPEFDRECAAHALPLLDQAFAGALDHWLDSPRAALALVILLDQMPRNIHRGTAKAFAYDGKAREIAAAAIEAGHDQGMTTDERTFLYLPFEHSENLADQERSMALFEAMGDAEKIDYALRHKVIIARFGRFPHRNRALGRESTAEELAFLEQPGSSF